MSPSPDASAKQKLSAVLRLFYALRHDLMLPFSSVPKPVTVPGSPPRVHFVYFSCAAHFEYLLESVRTLAAAGFESAGNLYLYIDPCDFFSPEQVAALTGSWGEGKKIVIRKTKHSMHWGGAGVIVNELAALAKIVKDMGEGDWLAKVDSDVLFSSDRIFKKVMESEADLAGQKTTNEFAAQDSGISWMQGGLFFLSRKAVAALSRQPVLFQLFDTARKTGRGIVDCPEDAFLSFSASRLGLKIEMMRYMLDIIVSDSMPSSVILEKVDYNWGLFSAWHCRTKKHWRPVLERLKAKYFGPV